MDILQYLIVLLKTQKQVGIEGLGTLYKKKTPGRYDAATHSFLPPSYELLFTTDMLENSNLAEFIQNKRGISEDAARYFISQFVTDITNGLKNGEHELENLGLLKMDNGSIHFIQHDDVDTGFEFFALPSVSAVTPTSSTNDDDSALEELIEDKQVNESATPQPDEGHQIDSVDSEESIEVQAETLPAASEIEETIENDGLDNETDAADDTSTNETSSSESVEEDQSDDNAVYEEISEVNIHFDEPEIDTNDTKKWDFSDDTVIEADDFKEEELSTNLESDKQDQDIEINDAFKLTSTTKEWDFDVANSYRKEEDENPVEDLSLAEEEHTLESKKRMPLYLKLLIALFIIIILALVAYWIKPELFANFSKNNVDPDQKIAIPVEPSNLKTQQDSLSFADSIMQNAEKAGLKVEPAKDTIAVTTKKTTLSPAVTYDIIITSFATESKAQQYIASLKKKGFDAKISAMHGKRKNISIANYNNIDSAEKDVIKFRKQFRNPEIYVQKIKNN